MDSSAVASSVLSGTFSFSDGSPIPPNSFVEVLDAQQVVGSGFATPFLIGGTAPIDQASGGYSMSVPTGRTYMSVAVLPVVLQQTSGFVILDDPSPFLLSMDMTKDEPMPALPGTVQITGTVTDPNGWEWLQLPWVQAPLKSPARRTWST
jgi:hypothetical protein